MSAHDKIRKLLAMTVENGCSEGIEFDSLRAKAEPKRKAKSKYRGGELKTHQALAACAQRVLERARAVMRDIQAAGAEQATGQNALVVVGYFDQLRAEQDQYWGICMALTVSASRSTGRR